MKSKAINSKDGEDKWAYARSQALKAVNIKTAVFWVLHPSSLVEVYRLSSADDGGSKHFRNVGKLLSD
jgi:hypothetical protein